MPERTDTRPNITPEGTFKMTVCKIPVKKLTENKQKPFYAFVFEFMHENKIREHTERVMAWQAAPLLKALRFPEIEPGIYEWEKEEANGRSITATIFHEPDKNDKSKVWARMTDLKPIDPEEIPF